MQLAIVLFYQLTQVAKCNRQNEVDVLGMPVFMFESIEVLIMIVRLYCHNRHCPLISVHIYGNSSRSIGYEADSVDHKLMHAMIT